MSECTVERKRRRFAFGSRVRRLGGAGSVVLLLACGTSKEGTEKHSSMDSAAPAVSQTLQTGDTSPQKETASAARSAPTPDPYFGELGLPLLDKAVSLAPKKGTSVVLLVVDALNAKRLGAYGNKRKTSPHIDKLAAEGVQFTGYVSNSSWTRPSFATIVTGLPKSAHHVELKNSDIDMGITTLAERFRSAGYRTAGFVGNPLVREVWGFGQGFQVYEDTHSLKDVFPPDRVLVDKAISWLNAVADDKPIFLMLFLTGPHAPYRPPVRHFLNTVSEGAVIEYPFREYLKPLPRKDRNRMLAAYDDEIRYTDAQIGKLMKALRDSGRLANTTTALVADHGEAFGIHNCYVHTYHMWEPVLRVPFILRPAESKVRGVVDGRPFTHVDLAPTLLAAAGIHGKGEGLLGVSILDVLADPNAGRERVLFSQYNAHGIERQAMREGNLKLVHHHKVQKSALSRLNELETKIPHADPSDLPSVATDGERFELYDLAADPGEQQDLFAEKKSAPETLRLMKALEAKLDPDETEGVLSDEVLEALKNAGYIVDDSAPGNDSKGGTK